MDRASRKAPSAFCAIRWSASSSAFIPSCLAITPRWFAMSAIWMRLKVKDLAARKYGGNYLVLLGCRQDEDGVRWRLLQCLQECVEGRIGEHVDLVYNIDFELTELRRVAHLIDQAADILHRVVGGGIQFENIERVGLGLFLKAVDEPGHNAGAGSFTYTPRGPQNSRACASLLLSMAFLRVVVMCS
jgi:hypothetical protein